jgi:replication factor A1
MQSIEYIIARILSAKPELTREEILKMIEDRERRAGGFLTRESAALSLAAELGVTVEAKFKHDLNLQIKDLTSGLRNVTITGRVIYVSQLKKFRRKDGFEGVKRSIYIADNSGTMEAVLWDEKATSFNPEDLLGKVVRLSHFSVKRKAGGRLELSANLKSRIEINPANIRDRDYPPLTSFTRRISDLPSSVDKAVNVFGLIEKVYPPTIFKRQNGGEGKVRRVEISDGSGKVSLVLWDNDADLISEDHVGRNVVAFKVKVKERFDGRIELHTRNQVSEVIILKS